MEPTWSNAETSNDAHYTRHADVVHEGHMGLERGAKTAQMKLLRHTESTSRPQATSECIVLNQLKAIMKCVALLLTLEGILSIGPYGHYAHQTSMQYLMSYHKSSCSIVVAKDGAN